MKNEPVPNWDDLEHALLTLRSISSMLCLILEGQEDMTDEYRSIEGVIQLADFQEKKLQQLINPPN
ncbi:hypothetical protein M6B40_001037 [Vibrio metschnikovii]|uniref:Uncharacterized protein n=1 Tax=bacterium 19PA01SH03 TaxID=2920705 RepID=A0AAU6SR37_UNCXX|nr:hypothetical protein [Vibrio metschnikovii]EKO3662201.1 hypothetical protein [Vibrio metschnikovii]